MRTEMREREAEDQFLDFLVDLYGIIAVCGYSYDAGYIFKRVDPVAYRQEFLNWTDSQEIDLI